MSNLRPNITISERRGSLRLREADQVDAARRLARDSRASLNPATDPKWYEHTEDMFRCDIADLGREEVELEEKLRGGRITSASWHEWQDDLVKTRNRTRMALNLAERRRPRQMLGAELRTSLSSTCSTGPTEPKGARASRKGWTQRQSAPLKRPRTPPLNSH